MKPKTILLICVVVFFAIVSFLVVRSEKLSPIDKKDPSALPPPSREFDNWRKGWEKSRMLS